MEWRPLITEPEERARLVGIVREIARALPEGTAGDLGVHCDYALLRAYLATDDTAPDSEGAMIEHVAAALAAARETPSFALHGGLANVGWTIAHLADDENAQQILSTIDSALSRALHSWSDRYDLISGLVGIGVYALERGDAGRALATRVLEILHDAAQKRGPGLAWHTPARLLPDWQRERAPDGYFNLGLAHGMFGIVALCARCVSAGIETARAKELVFGAVSYLLDVEPPNDEGRYPAWHTLGGEPVGDRTRLAWCYGDVGVAAALLSAAHVDTRCRDAGLALARACARRPQHPSVRDTAICHGAAGVTHMFNRMYQATGDDELRAAARRWLSITLDMRVDHPYAGFPAFDGGTSSWRAIPTLIDGAAGVALVLHALITDIEPLWDRVLLLDVQS